MTVSLVVVSHSARLAEGVAELAGQMARGQVAIAAAGGASDGTLGTSLELISAALQQVATPAGTLVLLDLGSAAMASEMAIEQLPQGLQQRILLSAAPLVEGAILAAVEASIGGTLAEVAQAALQALALPKLPPQPEQDEPIPMAERTVVITSRVGLHARPAALFVQNAARFQAHIQVRCRERQANAKSIVNILTLGANCGATLLIQATGADATDAVQALAALVENKFGEE
ncbi:MAG TPA: dihydroxyacetone kinase phosphoryl donor subunit DhaM [Ktedonobacteraceae bacterium]|jgi:dihydroxyacetone kinase phosphotransfer subunit